MLLCLDCGNTRLKWGLHIGVRHAKTHSAALASPWLAQGALALNEIPHLSAVLAEIFTTKLVAEGSGPQQPSRVIACSVANAAARATISANLGQFKAPITWIASTSNQCGVRNQYDDPALLGADRWAALIAAHQLHCGGAVVVNAGTATTIDIIDALGIFQGGLILPGLDLMRHSLAANTAQLPLAAGNFQALPRNTHDAIASGCLQATAGAITRMFTRLKEHENPICLLSGGAANPIAPLLDIPVRRIDNLVLEGLACIGRANTHDYSLTHAG